MSESLSKTDNTNEVELQSEPMNPAEGQAALVVAPAVLKPWKLQNQVGRHLKPIGEGTEEAMREQFQKLKDAGGFPGTVQLVSADGGIVSQFGSLVSDEAMRGTDPMTGKEYDPVIIERGNKPMPPVPPSVLKWLESIPETVPEEGKEHEGVPPYPGALKEDEEARMDATIQQLSGKDDGEPISASEPTPELVKFLQCTPPPAASAPVLGVAEHMPRLEAPAPTPIEQPTAMTAAEALMHIKTLFKAQKKQVEKMERKFYKELYTLIGKAQDRGKPFDGKLVAKAYVASLPKKSAPTGKPMVKAK